MISVYTVRRRERRGVSENRGLRVVQCVVVVLSLKTRYRALTCPDNVLSRESLVFRVRHLRIDDPFFGDRFFREVDPAWIVRKLKRRSRRG